MKIINNKLSWPAISWLFILLVNFHTAQISIVTTKAFIAKYKDHAIEQMALFNIPASVTMAQAIKESGCGSSMLARRSNNYFGIKCHKEWGGSTFMLDDDSLNESFRKYNSVEDSFFDHSMFLVSRPRYGELFELKITDHVGWCIGLKKAGYATDPLYANDLLFLIEVFDLTELDKAEYLVNQINIQKLLSKHDLNVIPPQENWLAKAEKHSLAKVIFNVIEKEEGPLLVQRDNPLKNAD